MDSFFMKTALFFKGFLALLKKSRYKYFPEFYKFLKLPMRHTRLTSTRDKRVFSIGMVLAVF